MKRHFTTIILYAASAWSLMAAPSILDIKHSITDDNIVPPESFETKALELEENFYLSHYAKGESSDNMPQKLGTAQEYEQRLSRLPAEIEMPYNSIVGKYIDMYVGKRRGMVSDMLALHNYYGNIFLEELEKAGLPTELQYLPVIESALKPNAVSRAGAAGLWQFMPATARGLGMEVNSLVDERRDPRSSSRNAARYLKELYGIYGDWSLAIAAYNCGPGNVNKALRRAGGGKKDFWEIYRFLPAETRGYVPAFIAANYAMNYYKDHNITPRVISRHLVTDTVLVDKRVHFNQIANVLNIPVDEIRMLNPQYRKDVIPGDIKPYPLVLPSQQVLSYVMSEPQILAYDQDLYRRRTYVEPRTASDESDQEFLDPGAIQPDMAQSLNAPDNMELAQNFSDKPVKKTHIVGRGENLRDIARRYGVSATDIKRWNNLRRGKVKEGDEIIIETYEAQYAMTPARETSASELVASREGSVPPPHRKAVSEMAPVPPRPVADQQTEAKPSVPRRRVYGSSEESSSSRGVTKKQERQARQADRKPAVDETTTSGSVSKQAAKKGVNSTKGKNRKGEQAAAKSKGKKGKGDKAGRQKTYKARKGDTLERIAKKNGTTVSALKKANNIKGSNIQVGQSIKIPAKK